MDSVLLYLQPSKEIHLARGPAGANQQELKLFFRDARNRRVALGWDFELTAVNITSGMINISQDTAASILVEFDTASSVLRIKPTETGIGSNEVKITFNHTLPGGTVLPKEITAKVHVHNQLDEWWFGIDSMTVPRDDLTNTATVPQASWMHHAQVSVYAHFDRVAANPNDIVAVGDVTGHTYINLTSGDPNIATLSTIRHGWLRGVQTGTTTISGEFPSGNTKDIPLEIFNFYGRPTTHNDFTTVSETNPLCVRAHNNTANPDVAANFLFVAEGFNANHQALFDALVDKIVNRFFTGRYRPFNHLRDDIIIWKAFTASKDQLVTEGNLNEISAPAVQTTGAALTGNRLIKQASDTFFGLYYPLRDGDSIYTQDWHVVGDPRRYPLEMNYNHCIQRFIASLSESGTPSNRIGRYWFRQDNNYGKDIGFVFIVHYSSPLINREGNYGHFIPTLFNPPNANMDQAHQNHAHRRGNNSSNYRIKVMVPDITSTTQINGELTNQFIAEITDIVAHELGHSLVLGDEYEQGGNNNSPFNFDNISVHTHINQNGLTNPEINPQLLRWKNLHRISRADRIDTAVFNHSNISNIVLTLTIVPAITANWQVGENVHIREFRPVSLGNLHTQYAGANVVIPGFRILPVLPGEEELIVFSNASITSINNNTIEVTIVTANLPSSLGGLAPAALRARLDNLNLVNGVIYTPRTTEDNNTLFLIDEEIIQFMTSGNPARSPNPTNLPLSSNQPNCNNPSSNPDTPPNDAINIGGGRRRFPANAFEVVGAYEGGEHGTCQNYRPTGFCKMRSSHDKIANPSPGRVITYTSKFCHVCQYLITTRINPSRLSDVDGDYPGFR